MRDMITPDPKVAIEPSDPILSARGICLEARGQRLLDGIDLEIRPGRCTVILGPNGAGKSVLLRVLHGLLQPSAGRVLWQGRPLDRLGRRAQALVFQRPVLLRRSVRANLAFALGPLGLARQSRRARVDRALAEARLETLAQRPARVLSGGEQQRLALARALITEPEVLLLDEPTANLDPAATQVIEDQVRAARAAGVTPVLVTHDLGQARRLGDDLVFLQDGRVAETGPVDKVLSQPKSEPAKAWCEGRLYIPNRDQVEGSR